jgi:hypothetical protein
VWDERDDGYDYDFGGEATVNFTVSDTPPTAVTVGRESSQMVGAVASVNGLGMLNNKIRFVETRSCAVSSDDPVRGQP